MKQIKGFFLGVLLTIFSTVSLSVFAKPIQKSIDVFFGKVDVIVNDVPVKNETLLYNGRTYMQIREVAEMLDMDVSYDAESSKAFIDSSDNKKEPKVEESTTKTKEITTTVKDEKTTVDPKNKEQIEKDLNIKKKEKIAIETNIIDFENKILQLENDLNNYKNKQSSAKEKVENVKNEKNVAVIKENDDGTYSYEYLADSAKVESAQSNLDFYDSMVVKYENFLTSAYNQLDEYSEKLKIINQEIENLEKQLNN